MYIFILNLISILLLNLIQLFGNKCRVLQLNDYNVSLFDICLNHICKCTATDGWLFRSRMHLTW